MSGRWGVALAGVVLCATAADPEVSAVPHAKGNQAQAAPPRDAPTATARRQRAMRAMEGDLEAMRSVVLDLGDDPSEMREKLAAHGDAIKAVAEDLVGLFPDGSRHDATRAKPDVWEDRARFAELAQALRERLEQFAGAARSGDGESLRAAYKSIDIRGVCDACHIEFRKSAPAASR